MKKSITIVIALILTCISLKAQYFEGFSVKSYKITSAWPTSFRSVKGKVSASIGNTADTRAMSGITATVYRNGVRFAQGYCNDITFYAGTQSYTLSGWGELASGISLFEAIRAALSFNASEYTVDFTVNITHPDGKVDHVVRKDVPITHYLKRR